MGGALKLIAIVFPLGLDTFAVSVTLGLAGLRPGRRSRLALLFTAFESVMPLVGLAFGAPLGRAIGRSADFLAAGLLLALGLYALVNRDDEPGRLGSLTRHGTLGALALALGISLDELAIGFSAGLLRLEIVPLVLAVGAQAFLVTQLGLRIGARVGAAAGAIAERLAAAALLALAAALLAARLSS